MEHIFLRVRLILISFSVVTDLLFYFSLLHLISSGFSFSPFYFNLVFWMIPLVFIFFFLSFKFDPSRRQSRILANIYRISGFFMTIYLPKIIFLSFHLANMIFNLITRGFILILNLILSDPVSYRPFGFFTYTGLGLAIILFILLVYGALLGRFFFKTEKITLGFSNLPAS